MTSQDSPRFDHVQMSRRTAMRIAGAGSVAAAVGSGIRPVLGQEATPELAPGTISLPDTGAVLPEEDVTFHVLIQGPGPRTPFYDAFFAAYREAHPNIKIDFQELPAQQIQQVLPLGVQSRDEPDLFMLGGSATAAEAVSADWVSPLDDIIPNFEDWKAKFPSGVFLEGITMFDGKTYTFPLSSNQRYDKLVFYNPAYMEEAGIDASAPMTLDQFREAARKLTEQGDGQYYGLALGAEPGVLENLVCRFGTTAGAIGGDALGGYMNWQTGEYNYLADEYLAAIDLLLGLQDDGSIVLGYLALTAREAEPHLTEGTAAMVLDGPWVIARWQERAPDFSFGVSSIPVPNDGSFSPLGYAPGGANPHFVGINSELGAVAGDIFSYWGSPDGQAAFQSIVGGTLLAIFPEAQERANLDAASQKCRDLFAEQMRLHPDPRARNPNVARVYLEYKRLQPNLGEVLQGVMTGQITDIKSAMQDLKDRADAELDRAIKVVNDDGHEVSRDDWVFPNWDPTADYTAEDYEALA